MYVSMNPKVVKVAEMATTASLTQNRLFWVESGLVVYTAFSTSKVLEKLKTYSVKPCSAPAR